MGSEGADQPARPSRSHHAPTVSSLQRLQGALAGDLCARIGEWLTPDEVEATRQRVDLLLQHRVHPFQADFDQNGWQSRKVAMMQFEFAADFHKRFSRDHNIGWIEIDSC